MLKINIPEGKSLKEIRGLYTYPGPMVLELNSRLKVKSTFTDGTPWMYVHHEEALARQAAAEGKTPPKTEVPKVEETKVEEVVSEEPTAEVKEPEAKKSETKKSTKKKSK